MFARVLVAIVVLVVLWAAFARPSTGAAPERVYVVEATDTLWSIAVGQLPGRPAGGDLEAPRAQRPAGDDDRARAAPRAPVCLAAALLDWRRGPRRRLPRHGGLDADRPARAQLAARPARRGAAPRGLRRGDAAPAAALRDRAPRPARGLPHALPRRPLPRAPGDAQELRPARPGGADHDLRPARARRALRRAPAHLRPAHVRVRARRAAAGRAARPRRLRARDVRGQSRRECRRLRPRRGAAAGALRRRGGGRARRPVGARARRCSSAASP